MNSDHMGRATKMFAGMLKYMGEQGDPAEPAVGIEIAQKLLHQGLKRPELKDELYMQLLKQTRGNPNVNSRTKAWELFQLTAATMPPSKVSVKSSNERVGACAHPTPCPCSRHGKESALFECSPRGRGPC
eukprot:1158748-Pelagomonas_calceolata.AAC.12